MRYNSYILFLLVILFTNQVFCKNKNSDVIRLQLIISELSSEGYKGRFAGSEFETMSAEFISSQLQDAIIAPYFNSCYYQPFEYFIDSTKHQSQNVIGFINNNSDSAILIISHYDHIGLGGPLSKSFFATDVHPGADDNASGVSANLLLASRFSQSDFNKYNLIFLFPGAHEVGLFGSKNFFYEIEETNTKIALVINLDMIGRLDNESKTLLSLTNISRFSKSELIKYSDNELNFILQNNLIGDHTVFLENNIPVIFLSTGIHQDYHKTSDTEDKINYKVLLQIVNLTEKIILTY
ncbi:MAG: hypothetical protein C0596_13965 [Marinilabiliales bacterium]|nr:MAG: hypothetical protein C0596_13965 [Marinilabiliales bacterium]